METTEQKVSWPHLKAKMNRAGVSVGALARATGEYRQNVSAVLNGSQYCSADRARRLVEALRKLGVDA